MATSAALLTLLLVGAEPANPPARVTLPLAAYEELLAEARATIDASGLGNEVGYTSVEHALTVAADRVQLETTLDAFALGGRGGRLALPDLGLIYEVELMSGEASLTQERDGAWVRVGRSGRARLKLRSVPGHAREGGEERVNWSVPAAGAARLAVTLPRGLEARLDGGTLALRATESGTRGEGSLDVGRRVTLAYAVKETATEEQLLGTVSEARAYVLGDGSLTLGLWLDIEVLRGRLEGFRLEAPPGLEVVSAEAEGNTVVSLERDADGRLAGRLGQQVRGGRTELYVQFEGEWSGASGDVELPDVRVLGLERGESVLAVASRKPLLVVEREREGYERIDEGDVPERLRSVLETPVLYAARGEGGGRRRLVLGVSVFADAASLLGLVDEAKVLTLWGGDGRRIDALTLRVQSRESVLRLKLPEGGEVWSAELDGSGVRPLTKDGELLLPLGRGERSRGARQVRLVVVHPAGPGAPESGRWMLAPSALPYPATTVTWDVLLPEDREYWLEPGSVWTSGALEPTGGGGVGYTSPASATGSPAGGTASISGVVTDSEKGVLPGATVTASVEGSAWRGVTTTDASGEFRLLDVPAGRVHVEAKLQGLATVVRVLDVGAGTSAIARFQLPVSGETAELTVTAEAPPADRSFRSQLRPPAMLMPPPPPPPPLTPTEREALQKVSVAGVAAIPVSLPERGKRLRVERHVAGPDATPLALEVRRSKKGAS